MTLVGPQIFGKGADIFGEDTDMLSQTRYGFLLPFGMINPFIEALEAMLPPLALSIGNLAEGFDPSRLKVNNASQTSPAKMSLLNDHKARVLEDVEDPDEKILIELVYNGSPDPDHLDALEALWQVVSGSLIPLSPQAHAIEPKDWQKEALRQLPPIQSRFVHVHGSHLPRTRVRPVELTIDAHLAFGTGHHETTYGCILALESLRTNAHKELCGGKMFDAGCGTGILAMAASRLLGMRCVLGDLDPLAIQVAQQNLLQNSFSLSHHALRPAKGMNDGWIRRCGPYDLVCANILARVLVGLMEDLTSSLRCGGYMILSGILDSQWRRVLERANAHGCYLVQKVALGGWSTLLVRKVHTT